LSEHPNALLIRRFFAAATSPDFEVRVAVFFRDDVVWHVAGDNPLAGEFTGAPAVLNAMRRFAAHSEGTLKLETRAVFADKDHAIAVHWASAKRADLDYQAHEIDVFHISDARISEFWSFSEDQAAADALWS
jgi:ketosteroid isomerase-like protein